MFNAAKDALTSRAARTWANNLMGRYGSVDDVKIDSRRKTIEITCLLEGEPSAITIKVENYTIEASGGQRFIRASQFTCSRPWLQKLLMDYGPQRRVELPAWATAAF